MTDGVDDSRFVAHTGDDQGRFEPEVTDKDAETVEYLALFDTEQVIAPIEQRFHGRVCRPLGLGSVDKKAKRIVKPPEDLVWIEEAILAAAISTANGSPSSSRHIAPTTAMAASSNSAAGSTAVAR